MGVNTFELSFDQFTGYQPMLYELATIFGIDLGGYSSESASSSSYNSSQYNVRFNLDNGFSVNLGLIGSLVFEVCGRERYFGIQDMIHVAQRSAIHPNKDANRLFIGANYDYSIWTN